MIAARHNKAAHFLFRLYLNYLMKKNVHSIQLFGNLPEFPPDRSILLLPNHSSWWDGFIIYLVIDMFWHKTPWVMMEEKQLGRFSFFRKLGAFSVRPGDREDVEKTLNYASKLLTKPENLLFMFPQGKLLPWHKRPVILKNGYVRVLDSLPEKPGIYLCGIRLEFTGDQYPVVFLEFRPVKPEEAEITKLTEIMETLLKNLEQKIASEERSLVLFSGRKSLSD